MKNNQVGFYSTFAVLAFAVACGSRPQTKTTEDLAREVATDAQQDNLSRLVDVTVGPSDIDEVGRELKRFGWHPSFPSGRFLETRKWTSLTKKQAAAFVASYKDIFEGKLVRTASLSIDLNDASVDTPAGPQNGNVVFGHLKPRRLIMWFQMSQTKFRGVFIPEIYKVGTQERVNLWIDAGQQTGNVITRRALLETTNFASCTFPRDIQFDTKLRNDSSREDSDVPVIH